MTKSKAVMVTRDAQCLAIDIFPDKTRMHSSRMRTAGSSSHPGGLHQSPTPGADTLLGAGTPREQLPPDQIPLEQTPPGAGNPPRSRHPPEQAPPPDQAPPRSKPPLGPGTPPCRQNSWHTLLKILPCLKLRLRVIIIKTTEIFSSACQSGIVHGIRR